VGRERLSDIRKNLKQIDALSPFLFNFALQYAIRRVQLNQDGLKLNVKNQLLVYTDDVSVLGGSVRTLKKNAAALVVASKETGPEVNVKTKNVVMSRGQKARGSHNVKIDNSSFERVEDFKLLGTTNQIYIQGQIKSRVMSENVCCHSVRNLLSSSVLSKNLETKIYRTVFVHVVL
jgi:hypothetical protein